jgi:hypothetical protein
MGIPLDTVTYFMYQGLIVCPHCKFKNMMTFSNGHLLGAKPLLEEKYLLVEANTIPEQPVGDYLEATECLSVGAYKAAAVMMRRAIQGALLIKGIPDQRPGKMIDDARYKHNLLSEKQHHLATTVTFFGGKGGHPADTEINKVGEIEASNGLWVTKVLLLALFPPPPAPAGASAPSDI